MADNGGDNKPQEEHVPTLAEVQQIADAAAKEAVEANSKEEAREKVRETVKEEAAERKVELSDDDCNRIADATITGMEARGLFEVEETPPPPDPQQQEQQQQQETPPEGNNKHEEEPRKRTLAERFVGRK
jgi:hypothetical protein